MFDLFAFFSIPHDSRTYRVDKQTGLVEVKSWGWSPIGIRLSPSSGYVEKDSLFGWCIISKYRINPNNGRIVIENWLGYTDTGFRINKSSGVLEENKGFFGWYELNQRIDPSSGVLQYRTSRSSYWHPN